MAPHLLRFTIDLDSIDLTSSPYWLMHYVPSSPDISAVDAVSELEDGGERIRTTRRNVSETIEVMLRPGSGFTMAQAQSEVQRLENLFRLAEERQDNKATIPLYLEFQPKDTSAIFRSEILSGKVVIDDDGLSTWAISKTVLIQILITRRFYWEQSSEVELPLWSTANPAPAATGGVIVNNRCDSGYGNWVYAAGGNIGGSIPSPIRLEINNNFNNTTRFTKMWVGQNIFSSMNISNIIEAETADHGTSSTAVDVAGTSGGKILQCQVSSSAYQVICGWDLTSSMLSQYKGRFFRIFAKFGSNPPINGLYTQFRLYFPSGTYLTLVGQTPEVMLSTSYTYQDLGTIQLPPWLTNEDNLTALRLGMFVRSASNTLANLAFDYIHITPLDGFRVLDPVGYGTPYGYTLTDDAMNRSLFVTDGTTKAGYYVGYGNPLMVWPGRNTKFYFMARNDFDAFELTRTYRIRIFYRPRRLTV